MLKAFENWYKELSPAKQASIWMTVTAYVLLLLFVPLVIPIGIAAMAFIIGVIHIWVEDL